MLTVKLAACGNPDFGQSTGPLPGIPRRTVEVKDLAEASAVCLRFIAEHDLGVGNWAGGEVRDGRKKIVARVSYNGRVWPPGKWWLGMEPLLEPASRR